MKCAIGCLMDELSTHLHNSIGDYGLTEVIPSVGVSNSVSGLVPANLQFENDKRKIKG